MRATRDGAHHADSGFSFMLPVFFLERESYRQLQVARTALRRSEGMVFRNGRLLQHPRSVTKYSPIRLWGAFLRGGVSDIVHVTLLKVSMIEDIERLDPEL